MEKNKYCIHSFHSFQEGYINPNSDPLRFPPENASTQTTDGPSIDRRSLVCWILHQAHGQQGRTYDGIQDLELGRPGGEEY